MDIQCNITVVLESDCDFQCSISWKVRQDDTVKKVKEFIFSQVGIAEDQQELTYIGRLMEDDKKLSNYAVLDGSNIQLRLVHNKDDKDEAAVFRRNFFKLAQGITDPGVFGARLYAAFLVTAEVRDNAANEIHPPCKRVLQLLSVVEAQIKLYPAQNFPQFIKILCEEKCYYLLAKSLCPKLAEKYIQGAEIHTSDTSIDPRPQDDKDKAAVFRRNFFNLAQGITNPGVFGARLYAASLITAELRDKAAENIHPSCRRVSVLQLLSAVEAQIKLFPAQNFPQFIKILCKEKYYLLAKSLCPKLAEQYIQELEAEIPTSDMSIDPRPQDPLSAQFLTVEKIRLQIEKLDDEFRTLTFEFKEELDTKIKGGKEKLSKVKHFVSILPEDIKPEHKTFVEAIVEDKKFKDKDIEELFYKLNTYWSYINYSLLLYLIRKLASDALKLKMERYDEDMKSFRERTTVSKFVEIRGADCDEKVMSEAESKFVRVRAKLDKDASHCTLEDLHLLRKDFCSAYHLSDCALLLHNLETGSIFIEWWLPVQFEVGLLSLIKREPIEIFCHTRNIERLDIGGERIYDENVLDEISIPEQQNLKNFLDCRKCECLNEMDDHPFTHALKPGPLQYLESDCNEQLIISFEFQSPVKLHSIQLTGPLDGCAPKTLRLFINQPITLDFAQAQQRTPVEELELSEEDVAHDSSIQLNFVKYQNVKNLTIFVKDNQGNKATTVINHIGLYGNPVEWLDMSEFKEVPSCPWSRYQ
ncbi:uncharacterized protein LOC135337484 isoform X3 [Halichondria panicea]|uniref:uncharacterized protein LOC135337484 isoform X3 n=1 Tax=Halichondria panicea TaxID=6063 RepID=UPI00312BA9A4